MSIYSVEIIVVGFLRIKDELLEANRKELFKTHPTKAITEEEITRFVGEE